MPPHCLAVKKLPPFTTWIPGVPVEQETVNADKGPERIAAPMNCRSPTKDKLTVAL